MYKAASTLQTLGVPPNPEQPTASPLERSERSQQQLFSHILANKPIVAAAATNRNLAKGPQGGRDFHTKIANTQTHTHPIPPHSISLKTRFFVSRERWYKTPKTFQDLQRPVSANFLPRDTTRKFDDDDDDDDEILATYLVTTDEARELR